MERFIKNGIIYVLSFCSGVHRPGDAKYRTDGNTGGTRKRVAFGQKGFRNKRLLHRAMLWSALGEEMLHQWFSANPATEVHAYVKNGKYCVVNNTCQPQSTTVYRGDGSRFEPDLKANNIRWYTDLK